MMIASHSGRANWQNIQRHSQIQIVMLTRGLLNLNVEST